MKINPLPRRFAVGRADSVGRVSLAWLAVAWPTAMLVWIMAPGTRGEAPLATLMTWLLTLAAITPVALIGLRWRRGVLVALAAGALTWTVAGTAARSVPLMAVAQVGSSSADDAVRRAREAEERAARAAQEAERARLEAEQVRRRAEEARRAAEAEMRRAEAARVEAQRRIEAERRAEERRRIEEARRAEAQRRAEAERRAEWDEVLARTPRMDAESIYRLANDYDAGRNGRREEPALAHRLYTRAGHRGHVEAMARAGWNLANGRGIDADPRRAAGWLEAAADRGHPAAANNLGGLLLRGEGVEKDERAAVLRFFEAAQAGSPAGMANLSNAYRDGIGTDRDPTAARLWADRAVSAGFRGNIGI